MSGMKSLAKETAIYGISSILGKTLNWLLTPLFTYTLATTGEYGIITNLYAYVALIIVLLTFGMETGLFRFANQNDKYNPAEVYSTILIAVGSVVLVFLVLMTVFLKPVTLLLDPKISTTYIYLMALVLCMDAFSCIPFAYLRYKKRPVKFAVLKMLFIILYIVLCCFFLLLCPYLHENYPVWVDWFYKPDSGVLYILIANLIATFIQTCFLLPELTGFKYKFIWPLFKKILNYSYPLLILGIAGMLSQTIDKIIFPIVYPDKAAAMDQLGIYGACFKVAVVMVMFTQAFRYAYEPFIFSKNRSSDNRQAYAEAMKYFIIFGLLIFLGVMFYMDILKYFLAPEYWPGLFVIPVIMIGELFFGIYFNLSLWYKLTDKTYWGAIFSIVGCVVIIAMNILLIPRFGYAACAWASFTGYFLIMLISYFTGQKEYPVKYDLKTIGLYFALALILYGVSLLVHFEHTGIRLGFNTILLTVYVLIILKRDLPLAPCKRSVARGR